MKVLQFIKLSLVNVIRPSLSLGAWWPEGRSSSEILNTFVIFDQLSFMKKALN